ncbi:cob(I)yrinic acid a,c-diamide adenosyltransferase [Lacticaseibacillus baoqingensis]|uniref:Corrinoid adenosyltransferase n=1 Tax=Lacticaseibacillus baoqingensis TaxID=2486013 RepID=A0ABW4E2V8_9LACO|nr:cob(I)yrinic acid a,c-diamide adenosyltransferase [Lacticaseibacillus baoqingensis]
MVKIYTKRGDAGQTMQTTGKMVSKTDPQIQALGAIDECQSYLGVVVAQLVPKHSAKLAPELQNVQRTLYHLQADIAVPREHQITLAAVTQLETRIDEIMAHTPRIKGFILPGGGPAGAGLQYARTLARKAERAVVALSAGQTLAPVLLQYLNRLSDYLFALALRANFLDGVQEVPSKPSDATRITTVTPESAGQFR